MMIKTIFLVFLFVGTVDGTTYPDLERLYENLTANYNKNIRPTYNLSNPTIVTGHFYLVSIKDFDEKTGKFSIVGLFTWYWLDYKMVWNPGDYGGIQSFLIPQKDVWTPEFVMVNRYSHMAPLGFDRLFLRVSYIGFMQWAPGDVYESTCSANVTYYPFDEHTCHLVFAPWMYLPYSELIVQKYFDEIDTSLYIENGLWELTRTSIYLKTESFFQHFGLAITFKRRPMFLVINILIPLNVMGLLNVLVFLLPAESGERVGFSVTVLLAMAVFLTIVSDDLPNTSEPGISRLSFMLLTDLLISTLITISVILGLRFHQKPEDEKVPMWLQRLRFLFSGGSKKRNAISPGNSEETQPKVQNLNIDSIDKEKSINGIEDGDNENEHQDKKKSQCAVNFSAPHGNEVRKLHEFANENKQITWKDIARFFDIFFLSVFFFVIIVKNIMCVMTFVFLW